MFDSGKMRHRITFQQYDGTVDQDGDVRDDEDGNWTDVRSTWAAIDPVSGREFYAAEQSQSEVTHKIRCRYFSGLNTAMRIVHQGRKYRIISVIDWELRHESFLIMAKELVE